MHILGHVELVSYLLKPCWERTSSVPLRKHLHVSLVWNSSVIFVEQYSNRRVDCSTHPFGNQTFPHSWLIITGVVTRVTRRVLLVEQELLTLCNQTGATSRAGTAFTDSEVCNIDIAVYFENECITLYPVEIIAFSDCNKYIYQTMSVPKHKLLGEWNIWVNVLQIVVCPFVLFSFGLWYETKSVFLLHVFQVWHEHSNVSLVAPVWLP
jgi:hypothetical protein